MKTKSGIEVPTDLAASLEAAPECLATWRRLRPSCRREHVGAVLDAKRADTRQRRIAAVLVAVEEWGRRHPAKGEAPSARRLANRKPAPRPDFGAPVEAFFAAQPPHLRAILEELRRMVEEAAPDAVASLKWGMPWFTVNGNMMCSLGGHKAHVNLVLVGPADAFDDPRGRLSGTGAKGRHLRLTTLDELPRAETRRWLRAAAKLARSG